MNVSLQDILESREYQETRSKSKLAFPLGQDETEQVRFCDIAQAGNILIGGSTGSGKSMLLRCLVASIISQAQPSDVQFMIAAGFDLENYNGIPHLQRPVATRVESGVAILSHAYTEMERRYQIFSQIEAPDLESYRNRCMERRIQGNTPLPHMPALVLIIDGFDYPMTVLNEDDMKEKVSELTQRGAASGIHCVLAAQYPSDDHLPEYIKVNIKTRIAFKAAHWEISTMILQGQTGAEKLQGYGDMLYLPSDEASPSRLQGAFITDQDIASLVKGKTETGSSETHSRSHSLHNPKT